MNYARATKAVKSSIRINLCNQTVRNARNVIFAVCLLLIYSTTYGQDRIPNKGVQAGEAYSISDIENVDLSNGNLMLNIPVANLSGRGSGSGVTVSMRYNSKLWSSRQTTEENYAASPDQGGPYYARERLKRSDEGGYDEGGWIMDAGEYRLIQRYRLNYEPDTPCQVMGAGAGSYAYAKNGYAYKLEMKMPDGGTKEFRPYGDGPAYQDYYQNGYFSIDSNGRRHIFNYSTNNGGQPSCADSIVSVTTTGMNYYSNDGTGIRLFVPHDANDHWTLYFPNGTVVENAPLDDATVNQRLTDRNGNKVLWKAATIDGHLGMQIVNDVGQYVFIYSDANGNRMINQSGVGGELLTTTVHSKTVYVNRKYQSAAAANANYYYLYEEVSESFTNVDSITLPSQAGGLQYLFTYNAADAPVAEGTYTSGFGELKSVTLPSGAKADYSFRLDDSTKVPLSIRFTLLYYTNNDGIVLENTVTKRDLKYDAQYDGNTYPVTETTLYNIQPNDHSGTVTSPDGGVTTTSGNQAYGYTATTRSDGLKTENIYALNAAPRVNSSANAYRPSSTNAYFKTEYTSVTNANGSPALTAIKDYDYDKNGNVLEAREYDWVAYAAVDRSSGKPAGIPTGATLKRKTVNTYYNPTPVATDTTTDSPNHYANPSSPKLHNILKSTEVLNENGTTVSRSEFFYDDASNKGNLTQTKTWDSYKNGANQAYSNPLTAGNSVAATAQYDQYGNPTLMTDGKGNQTQITYGVVNGPNGAVYGLYPTQTVVAYGTAIARTSRMSYDFFTGLPTSMTDADNNLTSQTTYDALGRPIKTAAAVGTPLEVWTQTEYDNVNRRMISRSDVAVKGDGKKVATQFYDQLGRVRLTKTLEDSETQSATNETDGIKVQTRYQTGNPHSYQLASNPYRAATSAAAINEESMGWTRSKSINTGKHAETETFAGAGLPAPWGTNANSTGKVQTDSDADRMLVTDQAGKQRISRSNALGQLTDVWEITAAETGVTEAVSFGSPAPALNGLKTSYVYDSLNNLTTVNQGGQTRTFAYSSLSRLRSATNPEMGTTPTNGTIQYQYDDNGNLTTKTDPRQVTTTYAYDALNRVTSRSYTAPGTLMNYQASPPVIYTYDNLLHAKGKLTKVTTGAGAIPFTTTEYQAFDQLGRVTQSQQTIDGTAYGSVPMTYTYNLSGAMIEQQYPSGRVVKNVLDNEGDLALVQSKKNSNYGYWNYAKSFSYTAAGAVSSMQLGNGKWESTQFNSRLQPTQIALGGTQNATNLLKLNFSYNTTTNGAANADNNGNVLSQTITVPTETRSGTTYTGFTATQAYTYDALNRLHSAEETIPSQTGWKQTFKYDRYGNRNFDYGANPLATPALTTTPSYQNTTPKVVNPEVLPTNNRFKQDQDNDSVPDYLYDAAGNTTKDANSKKFTYDAENKQTKVETVDSYGNVAATLGTYFYDGDGKRVKKVLATETTIFIYDASGKLVAEYANQIATTTAQSSYLTSDHLGSPRINTDQNGAVISRHDYQPFGEELYPISENTARTGYSTDEIRKQFTSYERDNETDLDFAQARYHNSKLGRFYSPDPYNIIFKKEEGRSMEERDIIFSKFVTQPQNWNKYIYVLNNPLKYVDPHGLIYLRAGGNIYYYDDEYYSKNKDEIGETIGRYSIVPEGTVISVGKGSTGIFEKYIGMFVVLGRRGDMLGLTSNELNLGTVHTDYDPNTPPEILPDNETGVSNLFSNPYDDAFNAQRRNFQTGDPAGRTEPYSGGYRHCVGACLLRRRYGFTMGIGLRTFWDVWHESSNDPMHPDNDTDKQAEDIGIYLGHFPSGSCEGMCLSPYPPAP